MSINYEAIFIIKIDENKEKIKNEIDNIIKTNGGEIYNQKDLGIKRLAYVAKGESKGHYYLVNFTLKDDRENKISRKINTLENVIKYLIVRNDKEGE